MIQLTYEQKNSIGLQYILDRLNPSSPYGQERVRRMTPYTVGRKRSSDGGTLQPGEADE